MTQTAIQCIPFGSPAKEIREIFACGIRNPESTVWNPESKTVSVYTFLYMGRYLALFISHYEQFSLSHTRNGEIYRFVTLTFTSLDKIVICYHSDIHYPHLILYSIMDGFLFSLCVKLFKKLFSSQGEIPCMVEPDY